MLIGFILGMVVSAVICSIISFIQFKKADEILKEMERHINEMFDGR